jgi:putative acetyltransferase
MILLPGDLGDPRIVRLLHVHLEAARAHSPPCSVHALDLSGLKAPGIALWAAWDGDTLLGVGALQRLDERHGEVKSMHVAEAARGKGVGGAMLRHLVAEAEAGGWSRLSLETGSQDYFAPARALYHRNGFVDCGPFGGYGPDPNSMFMTRDLTAD